MDEPATRPARAEEDRALRAFLAGDPAACRSVERWAWEIVHFRWFGIPLDERPDLLQEIVEDVWRAVTKPGFALRHGLKPLVRHIASARCIDRMRRRREEVEISDQLADPGEDPFEALARRDVAARLRAAVDRLDARCRDLIRLHFMEEISYAEIAARESRAEATLRVRMFHCLAALRKLMRRWEPTA
ncbi:MAG TPA: sigma-70 family RNA polymerase sigma factor [Candidatus Eisenbacteria bacterium]|jgi:RNA polymerase sigma factor (sigma-70 family)